MKRKAILAGLACFALMAVGCKSQNRTFSEDALQFCTDQVSKSIEQLTPANYTMMPRNIRLGGTRWNLRKAEKSEWTAGFWPGVLWYGYEASDSAKILDEAKNYTASLEFLSRTPAYDHDLGFLVYCSYGNGYRLTGDKKYKEVILATADTLATLFNPKVGTILSWPREIKRFGGHNTIIDNMINLEMMFWAAENGGSKELWDMAVMHADTTMKYHFRPDGSSYHVAVYDQKNGGHIRSVTHQGYADDSMWARGQGWGIYGYAICYRFTKDKRYLDFAKKITDLYLDQLPEDMIPYWDFNDPRIPNAPRDASAAAVVASALLELSDYVDSADSKRYFDAAVAMLEELDANYRSVTSPAVLNHSTGHHPNRSEIDYSIIYADYYYMEALLRLKERS